jgi:hypothetical protein
MQTENRAKAYLKLVVEGHYCILSHHVSPRNLIELNSYFAEVHCNVNQQTESQPMLHVMYYNTPVNPLGLHVNLSQVYDTIIVN